VGGAGGLRLPDSSRNLGTGAGLIGPGRRRSEGDVALGHIAEQRLYVLMLYAGHLMTLMDWLAAVLMRRQTNVPMWASLRTPIVMGFVGALWGVLLAPSAAGRLFTRTKSASERNNTDCTTESSC